MDELKIFGCNASKGFAKEICDSLGMKLGESESFKFDNDNRFVKILETVRGLLPA
jgi:phosphoribosylpyrophosphate synthetase